MVRNSSTKHRKNTLRIISGILFFSIFFYVGVNEAQAAPIKILNNSNHAYSTIGSTINQLLGRSYISSEFIIDFTTYTSCTDGNSTYAGATPLVAISTTTGVSYCNSSSATTTPPFPYQIFSTSFTGNPGDSVVTYNQFAAYDLTDDYAFTNSSPPTLKTPPAFYIAPGGGPFASAAGVEWRLDPTVYTYSNLSSLTAANTGIISWLRFNHPTWNWFDVKAGLRQTGTNWATGYNNATYGFGIVNSTTTNAYTDNQILLQPPPVATSTSGIYNQLTFTVYPFRQTRRVKDVLFQFSSAPAFQANELTLSAIQTLGGTKITEYTGTTATTSTPIYTPLTNAYLTWLTADNATDASANFSRIDTYSILGPLSQSDVSFSGTFDLASPSNNAISTSQTPTFTWGAAGSYLDISKYQLFVDGTLNKDNITGTSATPTSALSDGAHTWYIKAFNGGGTATSSVSTRTININSNYTSGYTFYVDNVLGSDNNIGTQAFPWATLSKAGLTAQAGDTVIIIKNANTPYRETLTPSNVGTAGSPITFRGVDVNTKPEIWGSVDVSSGWSVYSGGNANTYQRTLTTQPAIVAVGASLVSLTQRINNEVSATLNPGEWFWISNILYYRLASGESIDALQIEAATRSSVITSASYTVYQNIVVRYANSYGVTLSGRNSIAQGIEAYDSSTGIYVGGTNITVRYSVSARNTNYGIFLQFPVGASIYNSTFYNNTEGGGYLTTLNNTSATIRNNVFSGNGGYSFSFWILTGPSSITMSNNLWDTAGDSQLAGWKGSNNQELVDPLFTSSSTSNFSLQQFSPNIDAGVAISGLTTDILGNPIYGTPDIGPYEYQPPYTITQSGIPLNGSFRVYKDGHYRMTVATSSTATASLYVTPEGGFPSGDYSEWLNVAVNSWNTSGDYSKSWTESSSSAGETAHTIGDLEPNAFYAVSVDGTKYATFRANAGGQGTFTYSGGYSTHTFSIAQDFSVTNGPIVGSAFSMSSPQTMQISNNTSSSTIPIATSTTPLIVATSTNMLSKTTATSTGRTSKQATVAELRNRISKLQEELVKLLNKLAILLAQQLQNITKTI